MEAENKAAKIVAGAQEQANVRISSINSDISEKLNEAKEKELNRFNETVEKAETEHRNALERTKTLAGDIEIDIDAISEQVLKRVMTTIFD
ncbi:MAG TPA: hypothetical protein DCO79_05610 [Spirochaeta sp.]|nr:hypothetical protein [Spirochaeta sp.]